MLHVFTNGFQEPPRLLHSLRLTLGITLLTLFSLIPSITSGCLTIIIFLISTLAGTPESHLGFQLRSSDLTLLALLLSFTSAAIIQLISNKNPLITFFITTPFIVLFSSLRSDDNIVPLPAVANAFLGFSVIDGFRGGRKEVLGMWKKNVVEAGIAWSMCYLVNWLLWPEFAMDQGREMLGDEIRRIGAELSKTASKIIRVKEVVEEEGYEDGDGKEEKSVKRSDGMGVDENLSEDLAEDEDGDTIEEGSLDQVMRLHSEGLNAPIKAFGFAILDDLGRIKRIRNLLEAGALEGFSNGFFSGNGSKAWSGVLDKTEKLVRKLAALHSLAQLATRKGSAFSPNSVHRFVGSNAIHLWVNFYARMAAACNTLSEFAKPDKKRGITILQQRCRRKQKGSFDIRRFNIDREIDTRHLGAIRQPMYHHVLLKFRIYWRRVGGFDMNAKESDKHNKYECIPFRDSRPLAGEVRATFFALVVTQLIAEALADVTKSFQVLSSAYSTCCPYAPFRGLCQSCRFVIERLKAVFRFRLKRWEIRFMITHSLLLWSILGIALLIPSLRDFEVGQVSWAYVSAALAAQLTAEPTAFIGALRVLATIVGCGVAYGFLVVLKLIGEGLPTDYLLLPFMAINSFLVIVFVKKRFKYASFLYILTLDVILLCPSNNPGCTSVTSLPECSADWQYAVARTINTAVGVIFAMAFHFFFWPRSARVEGRHELCTGLHNASRLYRSLFHRYFNIGRQDDSSPSSSSSELGCSLRFDLEKAERDPTLYNEVYSEHSEMVASVDARVAKYVDKAYSLIVKQGSQWKSGPLATPQILTDLLRDFHKLNVSITEMASVLDRRPVLTGRYSRSAHLLYVDPFKFSYETVFISLRNLSSATQKAILYPIDSSLKAVEVISDLEVAILHMRKALRITRAHYAKARRDAHRILAYRGRQYRQEPNVDLEKLRNKLLSECHMDENLVRSLVEKSIGCDEKLLAEVQGDPELMRSDDSMLFFSFLFSAQACTNAFISIAKTALTDMKQIAKVEQKRKWWKTREAQCDDLEMSLMSGSADGTASRR